MLYSDMAKELRCAYCYKPNNAKEWPLNGDHVPFFYENEPGEFSVKIHCSECNKDWYVIWDYDPGQIVAVNVM